jgi:hypothetical protein
MYCGVTQFRARIQRYLIIRWHSSDAQVFRMEDIAFGQRAESDARTCRHGARTEASHPGHHHNQFSCRADPPGFHINYYQGALAGDIAVVTYPNRFLFRAIDIAHCIVMKGVFGSMRMYARIGPDKETHRIFRITPFEMG